MTPDENKILTLKFHRDMRQAARKNSPKLNWEEEEQEQEEDKHLGQEEEEEEATWQ